MLDTLRTPPARLQMRAARSEPISGLQGLADCFSTRSRWWMWPLAGSATPAYATARRDDARRTPQALRSLELHAPRAGFRVRHRTPQHRADRLRHQSPHHLHGEACAAGDLTDSGGPVLALRWTYSGARFWSLRPLAAATRPAHGGGQADVAATRTAPVNRCCLGVWAPDERGLTNML